MRNLFIFVFLSLYIYPFNLKALDLSNLELEDGFEISIFAENLDAPRQMAEGKNGTIFVGERGGQILALIDSDKMDKLILKLLLHRILSIQRASVFMMEIYIFLKLARYGKLKM